jgi:hypothetical protein
VLIVDTLLVKGVKFVLTRLVEAVEAEMYDESALREELLAAQMKLELGEIDDEEFTKIEEAVLAGLREVRERKEAASGAGAPGERERDGAPRGSGKFTIESVEARLDREEEPER